MLKFRRAILVLACIGWVLTPLSGTVQPVAAAASLTVSPASAAQGDWVLVTGTGFTLTGASARLYWNTTVYDSIAMAQSIVGPDGRVVFNVQIPPGVKPGTYFFFVWVHVKSGATETAQANVTVTASLRKAALITPKDQTLGASFKALLDSYGIATTLIDYNNISASTSFKAYDLVLISPDSSAGNSWGTAAARSALANYGRPILGLGNGGYYYFGTRQLKIGYGNGAHGGTTAVTPVAATAPIFKTPYLINGTGLFNSSSADVEIYLPKPDGSTFQYGQVPQSINYYVLIQQGSFFLWGMDGSPDTMTTLGQELLVNVAWYLITLLSRDTLVVSNLSRMQSLGYAAADVNDLRNQLTDLTGDPFSQTNMKAAWVDLNTDAPAGVNTAYTTWDTTRSSVPNTNSLVNSIDGYLENLKHAVYPNLKYFILVGSHEIIAGQARAADNYDETSFGMPSGYLADLYHSTYNGAAGYYLTDTVYSDLSYISDGWGTDSRLVPEMSVGRLVETPTQISTLISNYLASNASMSRANLVAIGSDDYMDGATFAANAMGVTADTALIQDGFLSSLVPPKLNAKHGVVYIGGHGDHDWMTTRKWDQGFMAGPNGSEGDTEELSNLDNAVIAAAGCHNGMVFPDLTYHNYDSTNTYAEFPERLAAHDVGVYAAASGFTWVSISGNSTNPAYTAYSEKATALFIQHILNDGGTTAGKAFQAAVKQYENDRGVGLLDGGDRRAISILTFYGIPNYRFVYYYYPVKIIYGYYLSLIPIYLAGDQAMGAAQASATATLNITDYTVGSDGLVTIPGADYAGDSNHPILPVVTTALTFPGSVSGVTATLDTAESTFVTINNDVPAVQAGTYMGSDVVYQQPVDETFSGYYPDDASLMYSTTTAPLGGGGTELNLSIIPVQYDHDTGQTKIWTHMVFNVSYSGDTSGSTIDSDGDGLPDWWETAHSLDAYSATGANGGTGNPDHDGLTNAQEFTLGTDPMNPDSDHDGFSDGAEVKYHTDPLNPGSTPKLINLPLINR